MPHIHQMGVVQEVVVWVVFEHKQAVRCEQIFFENQVGNNIDRRQGIGRAGEDVVELSRGMLQKTKHVHMQDFETGFDVQFLRCFPDKLNTTREFVDIRGIGASA